MENKIEIEIEKKNHLKNFYERHPEKKSVKIVCAECGNTYLYCNKSKHLKTKLHTLISEKLKNLV